MIFDLKIMEPLFWILEETQGVTQLKTHHPEGDVFIHSLQVLTIAFRESIDVDLILAAMLHDVGKVGNSNGHEKIAVELLDCHCSAKTLWLIEHHMRIWYLVLGEMKKRLKVEYLSGHPWLPELIMLARWDKMGRNPNKKVTYNREKIIEMLNICAEKHFTPQHQKTGENLVGEKQVLKKRNKQWKGERCVAYKSTNP